ncbi:Serine/threonine-protein phosphatase 6 regulatory ankyrin repeat subunit A, partial [Homalodisca vitripennis]
MPLAYPRLDARQLTAPALSARLCSIRFAFNAALHLSARHGLVSVTRRLLEKGASVQVVDCNGLTPALACAPSPAIAQCLSLILTASTQSPIQN